MNRRDANTLAILVLAALIGYVVYIWNTEPDIRLFLSIIAVTMLTVTLIANNFPKFGWKPAFFKYCAHALQNCSVGMFVFALLALFFGGGNLEPLRISADRIFGILVVSFFFFIAAELLEGKVLNLVEKK